METYGDGSSYSSSCMFFKPTCFKIAGFASAAFLVSNTIVYSSTTLAISLFFISLGLSPDFLMMSYHSGESSSALKFPLLSKVTEFDLTTSSTTDDVLAFSYLLNSLLLIFPKNEFSLRFLSSSYTCFLLISSNSDLFGAICSSFL